MRNYFNAKSPKHWKAWENTLNSWNQRKGISFFFFDEQKKRNIYIKRQEDRASTIY